MAHIAAEPIEDASTLPASVVIATYNRAGPLRACLEALARQELVDGQFEVVVVVDGSTDDTLELLNTIETPFPLRVLWQENRGQPAALNYGAAAARGHTCIFLDDDIVAGPGLVAEHLRLHERRSEVVGIGQLTMSLPARASWFEQSSARQWREHYARLRTRRPFWRDCYVANTSIARALFLEVGGFDSSISRPIDMDLSCRLAEHGASFEYLPQALADQVQAKTYLALMRDAELAGADCVELYRRFPSVLPFLLGSFRVHGLAVVAFLRFLLLLDLAPRWLALAGLLLKTLFGPTTAYNVLNQYSFWRGVRRAWPERESWRSLTGGTPILMYHAFGGSLEQASRYVIPVQRFQRQMAWLKHNGYTILGLRQLMRYRREYRLPPARSVVITIDDGYAETSELALPVLRQWGFPATLALVSDRVGEFNDWDNRSELGGRALLSWSTVRQMLDGALEIAAHSRTHPDLTLLSAEQARAEIEGSRRMLEHRLGIPVTAFAYPYGKRTPAVEAMVEEAGFEAGCGITNGLNSSATPASSLMRVEVRGTDSLTQFALAVRLGMRTEALARVARHTLGSLLRRGAVG